MTTVVTRAMYVSMLAPFLEKKASGRNLELLNVRPGHGGLQLAGTNGAMLAIFLDEKGMFQHEGDSSLCISIPPDALKHCRCVAAKPNDRWVVVHKEGRLDKADMYVVVASTAEQAMGYIGTRSDSILYLGHCTMDQLSYPEYMKSVPNFKPGEAQRVATFNGDFLSAFCEVARVDDQGRKSLAPYVRVHCPGEKAPSVVETRRDDFIGVVMPVAKAGDWKGLPEWWRP